MSINVHFTVGCKMSSTGLRLLRGKLTLLSTLVQVPLAAQVSQLAQRNLGRGDTRTLLQAPVPAFRVSSDMDLAVPWVADDLLRLTREFGPWLKLANLFRTSSRMFRAATWARASAS